MGSLQEAVPVRKVSGAKFVVWFVVIGALISLVFSYAIYRSFMSRPNIKIEDGK